MHLQPHWEAGPQQQTKQNKKYEIASRWVSHGFPQNSKLDMPTDLKAASKQAQRHVHNHEPAICYLLFFIFSYRASAPPRHRLGTASAPPRHRLGTASAPPRHQPTNYLKKLIIFSYSASAPPRHRLGTASAPPRHQPANYLKKLIIFSYNASAPPRCRLSTTSAPPRHRLGTSQTIT